MSAAKPRGKRGVAASWPLSHCAGSSSTRKYRPRRSAAGWPRFSPRAAARRTQHDRRDSVHHWSLNCGPAARRAALAPAVIKLHAVDLAPARRAPAPCCVIRSGPGSPPTPCCGAPSCHAGPASCGCRSAGCDGMTAGGSRGIWFQSRRRTEIALDHLRRALESRLRAGLRALVVWGQAVRRCEITG